MDIKTVHGINEIDAKNWNNLIPDNNPFCRHEFLSALEKNRCVGKEFGWIPRHIAIYDQGDLIGAAILYEKYNNYGEFVFDHSWQNAYERHNLKYYPKLVSSIPYTPANGIRFLTKPDQSTTVYSALLNTIQNICNKINASGFHCLFSSKDEVRWLQDQHLAIRHDCQFHWHNHNYRDFDEFLSGLRQKKRKNILRERKKVSESGVTFRQLDGYSITDNDWRNFSNFYKRTFLEKNGTPTLNYDFFVEIGNTMPKQILLVLADLDGECIAGSLMFTSDTHLYGRHWGCIDQVDYLHFEACYYQGIEYCIKHNLKVFEPGAQGEHKVARGFMPTITKSAHWIKDVNFKEPIKEFCEQESQYIDQYMQQVNAHNPYKKD